MRARLTVLVVAVLLVLAEGTHAAPVQLKVALGGDAALGGSTSLTLWFRVADTLPAVTEVRILTPAGIHLSTSQLGMATCTRPGTVLDEFLPVIDYAPCPHNALMGTGNATAQLRFDPERDPALTYDGAARLSLYAGESVNDRPGLIVIANASRPMRAQLTYQGYVYIPPPGFGVGLAIQVGQPLRRPFGADALALSSFRLVVGAASLRYAKTSHGRRVRYRPRAIPLPDACPAHGFRFRAIVRFAGVDKPVSDDAVVRCPSRRADR
jgi:hypothetical protein